MKLRLLLVFLFLVCIHNAHAQQYDTAHITVLAYDTTNEYMKEQFSARYRNAPLSDSGVHEGESLLRKLVADYNAKLKDSDKGEEIDLIKYKRQYIAMFTPDGQKVLWINGFCSAPEKWRNNIVYVYGGGRCYFQARIILGEKKTAVFYINGPK